MMETAHSAFAVHKLNEEGLDKAHDIAVAFDDFLTELEAIVGAEGRLMAIVNTKLEEACFFAKKAMAEQSENQESEEDE